MHILDKIVAYKQTEVLQSKDLRPIGLLEKSAFFNRSCNSYVDVLKNKSASGIIAEFKRKSPSRSDINLDADFKIVTGGYVNAGASAISILTDEHFFGGNNTILANVRQDHIHIPILRKDFIIDEYQIIEAKSIGADIILLICEILSKDKIRNFARLANSLGMEVLLEMHTEDQIEKINKYVSFVGVNNRDLKTFKVDYERSKDLFDQLPAEVPKIAESGLSEVDTCVMLYTHGFRGFLIGEQFMKQEDPGLAAQSFIADFLSKRTRNDH